MPSRDEYCPVAKSVEVLGDRWCLLLVRELLRGVRHFNELERSVPGISRSILAQRLRHLEREGVAQRRVGPDGHATEYLLTDAGRELGSVVGALNDWGVRWRIPDAQPAQLDPDGLMLWIRRHVVLDHLPPRRVVIGFQLRVKGEAPGRRSYWLVLQPGEASLCPEHPGFEEDLRITSDPAALYRLFLGRVSLAAAMDDRGVQLDGPPSLVRALPRWFRLSGSRRAAPAAPTPEAPSPT
jgi:DNA-binding HxlR family transcriptional regulator